ncbi:hypothetical protein O3M35_001404 [Rhynocoris fuscipes]|uniref:Egal-1 winged helix domain-containing protein n=1 Tax=Rhynocoris fuscipes TaxID=488301 RepID=A0AAW1CNT3_9HEMI
MVNIKTRDASTREIAEAAVQYFSNKLRQYGEGTEVPIKSLFGHRSQASREIRHTCGQQIDEFRTFLSMNSSDFIVYEDNVKLKEYACTKLQPEPEAVKVDSAASSHLLNGSSTTASSPPAVPTENITDSSINLRKTALAKGVNTSIPKVQAATAGNDGNIASVSVQEYNWNDQVLQSTKIIANTKECLDLVEDNTLLVISI